MRATAAALKSEKREGIKLEEIEAGGGLLRIDTAGDDDGGGGGGEGACLPVASCFFLPPAQIRFSVSRDINQRSRKLKLAAEETKTVLLSAFYSCLLQSNGMDVDKVPDGR